MCINETTEYDLTKNYVYITLTDMAAGGKMDSINLSAIFANAVETNKLQYKDVYIQDVKTVNDYGYLNRSFTKYATMETAPNGTITYRDSQGVIIYCQWVSADKSCWNMDWTVIGNHQQQYYRKVANLSASKSVAGQKIDFKSNLIPLPKGGSVTLRYEVAHPPFYKDYIIPYNINKYSLSACGKDHICSGTNCVGGCTELDPEWWNTTWHYREAINITSPVTGTNVQFQLYLNTTRVGANFNWTDGDDMRFAVNESGTITLLDYWIQTRPAWSASAKTGYVWIEVPQTTAGSITTVYMYYGNPTATAASNGYNTFQFFDDFSGASLNTTNFPYVSAYAVVSVSGSVMEMRTTVNGKYGWIMGKVAQTDDNVTVHYYGRYLGNYWQNLGMANSSSNTNNPVLNASVDKKYFHSNSHSGEVDALGMYASGAGNSTTDGAELTTFNIYQLNFINTTKANLLRNATTVISTWDSKKNPSNARRFYLATYKSSVAGYTNDVFIDWIFIRRYLPSTPTIVYGSQEQSICGNGILEEGEDCESGQCCNTATCRFNSSSNVCRANAGICDQPEYCTGSSATCPANTYNSTSLCRTNAGICDQPEYCDGTGINCPADTYNSTSVCRGMGGICDAPETCNGLSINCPADAYNSTSVCRASAGVCDITETCNGLGVNCPTNTFNASTTVCRANAGICDQPENCTGVSAACPADTYNSTSLCRSMGGICDQPETCDGSGITCPADIFNSTSVCRASISLCDPAESCSGAGVNCPANVYTPNNMVNTSWTAWYNHSVCYFNLTIEQERNLTQYDANYCGNVSNTTYFDYQWAVCANCTPILTNTTWTTWEDTMGCASNNTVQQMRNLTQFDSNHCGGANTTFMEYQWTPCGLINTTMISNLAAAGSSFMFAFFAVVAVLGIISLAGIWFLATKI